jgi:hypothetical protein
MAIPNNPGTQEPFDRKVVDLLTAVRQRELIAWQKTCFS